MADLKLTDVAKTYGGTVDGLKNIDLDIKQGELIVFVGPSGCGKSTLLRYLLGLHTPDKGVIRILGKDINHMSGKQWMELRRKMGVSFQGGALFNSMTVGENVRMPLREHTRLDENTMRIMSRIKLEVVNLAGFEHLMPAQLSGGMVKRAALARALACSTIAGRISTPMTLQPYRRARAHAVFPEAQPISITRLFE